MGLLPSVRTTPAPPFSFTGVHFAGPFITRRGHTRKPVMVKSYACIFICLTTKAVHIELCLDLTTEEFMAALRRFCSRRGTPSEIFSDNGTNFVEANNEFQRIRQLLLSSKGAISHFNQQPSIEFHPTKDSTHGRTMGSSREKHEAADAETHSVTPSADGRTLKHTSGN